jgi:hypothetical protein
MGITNASPSRAQDSFILAQDEGIKALYYCVL